MNYRFESITIFGDGSWGTSLANLFADNGIKVYLWCHDIRAYNSIKTGRENNIYFKGIRLHDLIEPILSLEDAYSKSDLLLFVIPSKYLRSILSKSSEFIRKNHYIISAIKGIENETLKLPGQIIKDFLPRDYKKESAFLSGPTFALEVSRKQPTTCVISSRDREFARDIQIIVSNEYFRCYTNEDIIGVQIGGAIKNIIALASGVLDGLGLGTNSQAALITRGLAEIARLGIKLGACRETFFGISGLGDLVLTATGKLSRNRSVGYRLGKGETIEEIISSTHSVAEAVSTTKSVYNLAHKLDIEMPICFEVYNILYNGKSVSDAIRDLMKRSLKDESKSF